MAFENLHSRKKILAVSSFENLHSQEKFLAVSTSENLHSQKFFLAVEKWVSHFGCGICTDSMYYMLT